MYSNRLYIILVLLTLVSVSCDSGYEKEDGKWAWISYDEAVGKRINYLDIDNQTFEILENNQYARDKSKVFYHSRVIDSADPKTFQVIENGYSKDAFQVFLDLEIVIEANPRTFRVLEFPYSRDDQRIFCGTLPLDVKDLENFKVTRSTGSKTTELTTNFIKFNPEYSYIDTLKYNGVIYGNGQAETRTERFIGFKKVE